MKEERDLIQCFPKTGFIQKLLYILRIYYTVLMVYAIEDPRKIKDGYEYKVKLYRIDKYILGIRYSSKLF